MATVAAQDDGWGNDDLMSLIFWGEGEALKWYSTITGKPIAGKPVDRPAVSVSPAGTQIDTGALLVLGLLVIGGVWLVTKG